jgi:hypothetical protein
MTKNGFKLSGHQSHPIAPVMLGDAVVAGKFAESLLDKGKFIFYVFLLQVSIALQYYTIASYKLQSSFSKSLNFPLVFTHKKVYFRKT